MGNSNQKILLKRTTDITKGLPESADCGELFLNIASGETARNRISTKRIDGKTLEWSDDVANEKKFATKEEVMDNELIVSTIITKINESVGLDENSDSILPNGESLSEAIIALQNKTQDMEESDPIFTKSPASSITSEDISNWNNKLGKTEKAVSANTSDSAITSVSASTVSFSGIPTGKTSTTVARGDHSHTNYALASDLNNLIEDIEDNELVVSKAINKIISSVGLDENGESTLDGGASLTDAIKDLQDSAADYVMVDETEYTLPRWLAIVSPPTTAVTEAGGNMKITYDEDVIIMNGEISANRFHGLATSATTSVSATTSISANCINHNLVVGDKTFNGSKEVKITASDLGLSSALKYHGRTTTDIMQDPTVNPIIINNDSHLAETGCVVFYNKQEFVWDGSKWELLGDEGSYKVKQSPVANPTADGKTTSFISDIEQDENGVITVTKKNLDTNIEVNSALTAVNANKLGGIDASDYYTSAQTNTAIDWAFNTIQCTHSSLMDMCKNNQLETGKYYQIIDYTYKVRNGYEGQFSGAGHSFDIIVKAISSNELSEDAKACRNEDDSYFANTNFAAWDLKYCIKNDQERFGWAATDGKGVVYYMKDEFGNEAGYDFKNIMFSRKYFDMDNILAAFDGSIIFETKTPTQVDSYNEIFGGLSFPTAMRYAAYSTQRTGNEFRTMGYDPNNKLSSNVVYGLYEVKNIFTTNVFVNTTKMPTGYFYTFSYIENVKNNWSGCTDATIDSRASSFRPRRNIVKPSYHKTGNNSGVYKLRMIYDNVFIMNGSISPWHCYDNVLEEGAQGNTIDSGCHNNILGKNCSNNIIGEHSNNNVFDDNIKDVIFGKRNSFNTIGRNSSQIYIWDDSSNNNVGQNCKRCFALKNCVGNIWEGNNTNAGIQSNYGYFNTFKSNTGTYLWCYSVNSGEGDSPAQESADNANKILNYDVYPSELKEYAVVKYYETGLPEKHLIGGIHGTISNALYSQRTTSAQTSVNAVTSVSAQTSVSATTSKSATTSVSATTSIQANRAIADGDGEIISETYALKEDIANIVKEIEGNEFVVAMAISQLNASAGFDKNGVSTLSSGQSLTEAINVLQNNSLFNDYISVTHSELRGLIGNSGLTIGAFYRITDYTYVVRSGYEGQFSAGGNYFDIIVKAVSENTLSEDAQACRNANDNGYFANTNFAAWELKYCIDNDQNRFGWAATNGKGVVYHLKDEFGNEAGYDFKNIKFFRNYVDLSNASNALNGNVVFEKSNSIQMGAYSDKFGGLTFPTALRYASYSTKRTGDEFRAMNYDSANKLKGNLVYALYKLEGFFPTNVFVKTTGADSGYFYTFSYIPNVKNNFSECYDATVYSGAASFTPRNNVIKPSYHKTATNSGVYKLRMIYDNVFIMNGSIALWHCYDNVLEEGCVGITIDSGCYNNIIKADSSYIVVGEHSNYNTFGEKSTDIILGKRNANNTIDKNCSYIYIWDDSKENKVGTNCQYCFTLKNCVGNIWEGNNANAGIQSNYGYFNTFKSNATTYLYCYNEDTSEQLSADNENKILNFDVYPSELKNYGVAIYYQTGYAEKHLVGNINGTISYASYSQKTSTAYTSYSATSIETRSSNGKCYLLGTNSATTYANVYRDSNVYMSGSSLYATSDKTLKTHIENIDGDLEKIKRIPKVIFHWNDDEEKKRQLGTYAQDVEEFYPEVVTKDENEIRGVAYDKMGIIALAGIDKLYEMIQGLQRKNKALEKRIKDLEKNN